MGTGLETPACAGAQAATALKAASVGLLCDSDSVANVHFPPVFKRCQSLSLAETKVTPPVGAQASFTRTPDGPTGMLASEGADAGLSPPVIQSPSLPSSSSQTPYCPIPGRLPPRDARAGVLFVPGPELPAPAALLALPRTVRGGRCLTLSS